MQHLPLLLVIFAAVVGLCSHTSMADSEIRNASNKRVLIFDSSDNTFRAEPGGKVMLYLDGDTLRTKNGGEKVFFVDGDDLRPDAGGIRLAHIDDEGDVRRAPGAKVMMNYRHPDICPTAHDKRVFSVDGDSLSHAQLFGVLHLLKPELFKISAKEEAELKKAMKEADAAETKRASADRAPGTFKILSAYGRDGIGSGDIIVAPKKGDAYQIKFTHKDAPELSGVGVQGEVYGDRYMYTAFGPAKSVGLCVYDIKGGVLTGKWYPWYYDGDAKNTGTENLKGPASLDGEFEITAAKAPATGAAYTGKVTIKPAEIVGASDSQKPYNVTWTFGEKKVNGIGIKMGDKLYVSSAAGEDFSIGAFQLTPTDGFNGNWFSNKNAMGLYSGTKMN